MAICIVRMSLTAPDINIIEWRPILLQRNHPTILKPNCPRTTTCLIGTGMRLKDLKVLLLLERTKHHVEYVLSAWNLPIACKSHIHLHQGCCSKMIWLKFAVFPSLVLKFIAKLAHRFVKYLCRHAVFLFSQQDANIETAPKMFVWDALAFFGYSVDNCTLRVDKPVPCSAPLFESCFDCGKTVPMHFLHRPILNCLTTKRHLEVLSPSDFSLIYTLLLATDVCWWPCSCHHMSSMCSAT